MSKKIYRVKETGEEVLLIKDTPMIGCTDCIFGSTQNKGIARCTMRPTLCVRQVFGKTHFFHFEKAF